MTADTMSHDQAVNNHAAERYILGQLSVAERDAFEGHYFDCSDCFEQIRLGGSFLSHARSVLDLEPEKSWLARALEDLRRPAPVFATALLLCALAIGGYQQSVIAAFRSPRVEASYFLSGVARGPDEKLIEVSRRSRLSLNVGFTTGDFKSYVAQIVTESGKVKSTLPVTPYTATIGMPAVALSPGRYSIVVQGVSASGALTKVGVGAFELKFID